MKTHILGIMKRGERKKIPAGGWGAEKEGAEGFCGRENEVGGREGKGQPLLEGPALPCSSDLTLIWSCSAIALSEVSLICIHYTASRSSSCYAAYSMAVPG